MPIGKKVVYWDSCVFLSWLKNEPRAAGITEGIEQTARFIDENKLNLVTSAITLAEVLDYDDYSDDARENFNKLFHRPNVVLITLDHPIAKLTADIRRFYRQKGIKLTVPDCIHLATAITYKVDEFQTLDGSGKKRRGDLLPLSGNVAGHNLQICIPYSPELSLLSEHEEESNDKIKDGTVEINDDN